MSLSDKQLNANRENAKKSTGPKSPDGKARVRNNGIKHGLCTDQTVINSTNLQEDQAEFDALLDSLVGEFEPDTEGQKQQVFRIAVCMWRLKRAAIAETAQIEHQVNCVARDMHSETLLNRIHDKLKKPGDNPLDLPTPEIRFDTMKRSRLLLDESFSRNLLRYEMRIDRSLLRAFMLLRAMKSMQKSGQAFSPDRPRGQRTSSSASSPRVSSPDGPTSLNADFGARQTSPSAPSDVPSPSEIIEDLDNLAANLKNDKPNPFPGESL